MTRDVRITDPLKPSPWDLGSGDPNDQKSSPICASELGRRDINVFAWKRQKLPCQLGASWSVIDQSTRLNFRIDNREKDGKGMKRQTWVTCWVRSEQNHAESNLRSAFASYWVMLYTKASQLHEKDSTSKGIKLVEEHENIHSCHVQTSNCHEDVYGKPMSETENSPFPSWLASASWVWRVSTSHSLTHLSIFNHIHVSDRTCLLIFVLWGHMEKVKIIR